MPVATNNFKPLQVAIIGGGLGGMAAAIALRRAGHHVSIYERRDFKVEVGASISCAYNGGKWLKEWGVNVAAGRPTQLMRLTMRDWDTGEIQNQYSLDNYEADWGLPYYMFYRMEMHEMLMNVAIAPDGQGPPAKVVVDHVATEVDYENGTVTFATLTGASTIKADLIIGADGIRSAVREAIGNVPQTKSANQTCYRCNISKAEIERLGLWEGALDPAIQFWGGYTKGELSQYYKIVMTTCSGEDIVSFYCFASPPTRMVTTSADRASQMPTEMTNHTAEGFVFAQVPVEEMMPGDYDRLDPRCRALLLNSVERKPWRLYIHQPYPYWTKGVACLLGDAAHPMMPHQSQGACMAIEDAAALGIIFSDKYDFTTDVEAGLKFYEHIRKPRATRVQAASVRATENLNERIGFSSLTAHEQPLAAAEGKLTDVRDRPVMSGETRKSGTSFVWPDQSFTESSTEQKCADFRLQNKVKYWNDAEKLDSKEGTVLLLPTTGVSSPVRPTPRNQRKKVISGLILFGLLQALWMWYSSPAKNTYLDPDSPEIQGYWTGVATKGMKWAVPSPSELSHKKHHHHGDHRHPSHGGWMSPKAAEKVFLSVPNNDSARATSKKYASTAHIAGSGFDLVTALNLKAEWEKQLGLKVTGPEENLYESGSAESRGRVLDGMDKAGVWIDTYHPLMNTPVAASLTLLTEPQFEAKLREDIIVGDPDSVLRDEVAAFHGLSASGDVTGKYIYAGYGRKADFELLQEKGIDLTGKIALVKYGRVFRGLKIKAAQEAGAIGCIIFTDPADDGEMTEANGYEKYPDGPARQASSIQRGSCQFVSPGSVNDGKRADPLQISMYPGDPTTPGVPAYKNATRIEATTHPISLPLSYEDAIPLLKALEGKGTPVGELGADWVGGLGFYGVEYFTGPSDVDLHLVNKVNTRIMPIWNVMATIPGHITDEVVIIGNHRDGKIDSSICQRVNHCLAWILGAGDPTSGTASHNEMVAGFGALLKKGWKPLRTIVLASWDAEEYGLMGSTEWTEDFAEWMSGGKNVAAYLNVDVSVSGSIFSAGASPTLALLSASSAEDVIGNRTWKWYDDGNEGEPELHRSERLTTSEEIAVTMEKKGSGIPPLGSGSDFTSFLQRYGVRFSSTVSEILVDMSDRLLRPALDLAASGFSGTDLDFLLTMIVFSWTKRPGLPLPQFADPGFHKHVEIAKILGLITLRLSDSLLLPLNTTQYARDLTYYLEKVESVASTSGLSDDIDFKNLSSSIEHLTHVSSKLDDEKVAVVEKLRKLLPRPHRSWMGRFRSRGCRQEEDLSLEERLTRLPQMPALPSSRKMREIKKVLEEVRVINKKVQSFEWGFISEEGIKEREWYKHKGVAPGKWLGYGATTFPALTEAITIEKSASLAQKEADELSEMLDHMAKRLAA
ncbi:N-acetylated-alpha-linked acidic dipeptidase, partial [Tremellales sp. Uapishka_1]